MSTDRPPLILAIMVVLLFAAQVIDLHAADLNTGVHSMDWDSPIGQHRQLSLVRSQGSVSYYTNRDMVYQAANQPVPGVIYGFYQDRLFALYIKLGSPNQAYYLEERFRAQFGPAKVTTHGGQTVYRWKDDNLKIKLKVRESGPEIKLGIYYRPLSDALNRTQAEAPPPGTFQPQPPNVKNDGLAPLL